MEPARPKPDEHFDLAIGDGRVRLKLTEARLTLSDQGISYMLGSRIGLRRFADLQSIRIQAIPGAKNSPWEALIELTFASGRPLIVQSSSPWGMDDPERDPVFIAFVEELHRRIPQADAARIRFLRGVPEGRHKVMLGVAAVVVVVVGGGAMLIIAKTADGTIPILEMLFPVAGLVAFGIWVAHATDKAKPGTYQPDALPRDLFPEDA